MNHTIKKLSNNDFSVVYNSLEKAAEFHSDKGYSESTLEKQAEFAKQRNYHYTKESNETETD